MSQFWWRGRAQTLLPRKKWVKPNTFTRFAAQKQTQQIELNMAIQRGERLPISDCLAVDNEVFMAFAGTLKANVGKLLDQSLVNEIFEMLRDWACRLEPAHVGNGQTPPNTD